LARMADSAVIEVARPAEVFRCRWRAGAPQHIRKEVRWPCDPRDRVPHGTPARPDALVHRPGAVLVQPLLCELGPAGAAELRAIPRDEGALVQAIGLHDGWRSLKQPFLQPRHRQRGHADLLAVEGMRPGCVAEHVGIVADQMLALARRLAAAADGGAEAGE